MPTRIRLAAFALACAVGVGSSHFYSLFEPKGFSREEARAKIGLRVKLKSSSREPDAQVVNTGTVAYADVRGGERVLIIYWEKVLPRWTHGITEIDRKSYYALVTEE